MPVRPRRIARAAVAAQAGPGTLAVKMQDVAELQTEDAPEPDDGNIFGAEQSFSEFAERVGAEGLAELLEASAAYITCVEGNAEMTRPQLLRNVTTLEKDTPRETVLRTFGGMLREGQIKRSDRNTYSLNEESPLLAKGRKLTKG